MKDDGEFRGTGNGPRLIDIATIVVVTAIVGAALTVWQAGPTGPLPMHFDIRGEADRWGDRNEMAVMIALMGALAAGVAIYSIMMERQGRDPRGQRFTYGLGRAVSLAATGLVTLLMTLMTFGHLSGGHLSGDQLSGGQPGDVSFLRVMMGGMALLFLALGAFLGRAKPNPVVGVRTYWSLRSRLAWDKSNRLAGRLFAVIGVLGLIATPIAPLPYGLHVLMICIVAAGLAAGFESWRVWRTDPDRA